MIFKKISGIPNPDKLFNLRMFEVIVVFEQLLMN